MLIGVGFLLLHLDIARGILSVYGGLGAAIGVKQAFGFCGRRINHGADSQYPRHPARRCDPGGIVG
jgi:hypothetical protein